MVFESISGFTGWKWSTKNFSWKNVVIPTQKPMLLAGNLTYSIRASLLFTWAYYVHNNTQHNSTRFGKYSRYTTTRYLYTRIPANGCIEPRTHCCLFISKCWWTSMQKVKLIRCNRSVSLLKRIHINGWSQFISFSWCHKSLGNGFLFWMKLDLHDCHLRGVQQITRVLLINHIIWWMNWLNWIFRECQRITTIWIWLWVLIDLRSKRNKSVCYLLWEWIDGNVKTKGILRFYGLY